MSFHCAHKERRRGHRPLASLCSHLRSSPGGRVIVKNAVAGGARPAHKPGDAPRVVRHVAGLEWEARLRGERHVPGSAVARMWVHADSSRGGMRDVGGSAAPTPATAALTHNEPLLQRGVCLHCFGPRDGDALLETGRDPHAACEGPAAAALCVACSCPCNGCTALFITSRPGKSISQQHL